MICALIVLKISIAREEKEFTSKFARSRISMMILIVSKLLLLTQDLGDGNVEYVPKDSIGAREFTIASLPVS
jgi:hypothetical protein